MDIEQQSMETRTTLVCGEPVVVYSLDRTRWFSSPADAVQYERSREKFLDDRARSLKKSCTFGPPTIGSRSARKQARRKRQRAELSPDEKLARA
jgi:hypothetical protein